MTFISYAQNREDVMLWRALGHIAHGFYIDVGANDPEEHSVTRAFYDAGWSGINVEPVPGLHRRLCEQRPRDINLGIAAGAARAELTLFDLPEVNGWATANPEVAAAHRAEGHDVVELRVAVRTLNDICAEHVQGDIHFLKIDVEGFEEEVLRGLDLQRWRPWVLVVEATMPNSRTTNHEQWEGLVSAHAYRFAWFDGLNRYYVAQERAALMDALSIPPNVFDDYIPVQLAKGWEQLTELDTRLQQSERRLSDERALTEDLQDQLALSQQELENAEHCLEMSRVMHAESQAALADAQEACASASAWGRDLEAQLLAIRSRPLWRITNRLGQLAARARRVRPKSLLARAARWAMGQPRLRRVALVLMRHFPGLTSTLRARVSAVIHPRPPVKVAQYVPPPHLADVTLSARKVLHDLAEDNRTHSSKAH